MHACLQTAYYDLYILYKYILNLMNSCEMLTFLNTIMPLSIQKYIDLTFNRLSTHASEYACSGSRRIPIISYVPHNFMYVLLSIFVSRKVGLGTSTKSNNWNGD